MRLPLFLVGLAAFVSCDPYGTESATSPVLDGGAGGDAGPGANDGSTVTDGAVTPDGGERPAYVAVIGGTGPSLEYGARVYVAPILGDGSLGSWVTSAPLPKGRLRAGAAAIGSTVFLVAGDSETEINTTPLIATTTSAGTITSWRSGAPLPEWRVRHGVVAAGGHLYALAGVFIVGDPRSTAFVTTPAGDGTIGSWTATTSLPDARSNVAAASDGKHVYVFGGDTGTDGGTQARSDGWHATVTTGGALSSWRPMPSLGFTTVSSGGAATATHVYQAGGFASTTYRNVRGAAIGLDGSLAGWITLAEMQSERALFALVAARGHLYAIGGTDGDRYHASVEVADILADGTLSAWRYTTALPEVLAEHSAAAFEAPP